MRYQTASSHKGTDKVSNKITKQTRNKNSIKTANRKVLFAELISLFLLVSACSSSPVSSPAEAELDLNQTKTNDSVPVKKESPQGLTTKPIVEVGLESNSNTSSAVTQERPKPGPTQYAQLNDAIRSFNDDKIFAIANQILVQSPNDIKSLNALAVYHYKKGHLEQARYLLTKILSIKSDTAAVYTNLGLVQLAAGEKRDAIKSFRKAIELDNGEANAAANLGAIYIQENDFTKAAVAMELAYNRGLRDPRFLNNYAISLVANGKNEKAEEIYKTLLNNDKNSADKNPVLKESLLNYSVFLIDRVGRYQDGLDLINRLKFVGGLADSKNRIIALENKAKAGLK